MVFVCLRCSFRRSKGCSEEYSDDEEGGESSGRRLNDWALVCDGRVTKGWDGSGGEGCGTEVRIGDEGDGVTL